MAGTGSADCFSAGADKKTCDGANLHWNHSFASAPLSPSTVATAVDGYRSCLTASDAFPTSGINITLQVRPSGNCTHNVCMPSPHVLVSVFSCAHRAHLCACVRACMRACNRACVRAYARAVVVVRWGCFRSSANNNELTNAGGARRQEGGLSQEDQQHENCTMVQRSGWTIVLALSLIHI